MTESRKCPVSTDAAPGAIGPYSQGISAGGFLFVSGQLPIDPATGEFAEGDIKQRTRQSLENVKAIAEAAGAGMDDVVKITIFLTDINDFAEVNAAYAEYFKRDFPARSAVQVAALPKGADVEIEAIVSLGK